MAFVAIESETNAGSLELEVIELLEAAFEGWTPAEGDLLVWLNRAWSRIGATLVEQASEMSEAAFMRFGEAIIGIPPIQAAPATVESIWTMTSDAGFTVPAGTQVTIEATGDRSVGFITVGETVIAPEAEKATILLQAAEPGAPGNGLNAEPQLSDSLSFVKAIELEGTTSGGVDEEEEEAYLSRLVEELQLISISLVIGRDFEIDARAVPSIARAKCIEAYNADEDEEEALAVSVYPIDSDGEPSSAPVVEALEVRQTAKLLSGINYYVGVPDYTTITGEVEIEVEAGFDPATVVAAVEAFWATNFAPNEWGKPTKGEGPGWANRTKAYRLKMIGQIEAVGGVARVVSFEWAKDEEALDTEEELELTGIAPLTKAGVLTVEAVE